MGEFSGLGSLDLSSWACNCGERSDTVPKDEGEWSVGYDGRSAALPIMGHLREGPADGASPRPRLGDLLISKGMITEAQLREALGLSYQSGQLLGRVLLGKRWIFEDELARTLAQQLDLPYVNLRTTGIDYDLARLVPSEIGRRIGAIPVSFRGDRIRVAFADPLDEDATRAIAQRVRPFECVVAELSDIDQAWRTLESFER